MPPAGEPVLEPSRAGQMKISVVVATRNRPALLARTLDAIKAQAFRDFDVIVVDDGSEQTTRDRYKELWSTLDSRFQLVLQGLAGQTGLGPSLSRNTAIGLARGELLAFCDDDDHWVDDKHLEAVSRLFDQTPTVDVCISNQKAVFSDGTIKADWLPRLSELTQGRTVICERFVKVSAVDLCCSGGFGHLNMLVFRKALLDKMGGAFWTRVNYEEDRDLFWRAVDQARSIAYTTKVVSQHHVPDPTKQNNASTGLLQQERWLVGMLVSQHIASTATHPRIVRLCMHHQGDVLRRLALLKNGQHSHGAAARQAWQALSCRFSIKWAMICVVFSVRAALKRQF